MESSGSPQRESSPTLIRMPAMRALFIKIRNSGIKNQIVRKIIRSADPINHKKQMLDISRTIGEENIGEVTIEQLFLSF